jgi:hypothetical protein
MTAVIWGASPQMRCERKKDRVEVNPELLAAASAQAEISFSSHSVFSCRISLIAWCCMEKPGVGFFGGP